ncbi:unnamed protein product [Effrenium voratum]|nr:unnamed protein product [Effrenium voratum]
MDEVQKAFAQEVGDGCLTKHELEGVLLRVGLGAKHITALLGCIPGDAHRRFDFSEFLRVLSHDEPRDPPVPCVPSITSYDLLVLGCGPAGVKAALEAAGRGLHVAVVEPLAKPTGAPTGAYSKCIREAVMAKKWTWPEIHDMVQQITLSAHESTMRLLRSFHVDVLQGAASFVDASTLCLEAGLGATRRTLRSGHGVVVATGSHANRLPMIPFELFGVFDSDSISSLDFIPKTMVVQGAGIIGLEYANMFAKLGAKVVVVEFAAKMLQMLDKDLQAALLADLAANKVEILLETGITSVQSLEGGVRGKPLLLVETSRGSFRCECLLSAVGRVGSVEGLGLEKVGVKTGRAQMIEVDGNQWTGVANIYAVGDVAGGNLATIGQAQAVRAVRRIFGWTIPEIAWAGLNEQEAKEKGLNFGIVQADYGKTVRGIVSGEAGFLKLIFDKDEGKVLGVHICGSQASELINFGADAVNDGTTIFEILQFVFPAVTFHTLYTWAAAEAKIRMSGVKSLSGGACWGRLRRRGSQNWRAGYRGFGGFWRGKGGG